LFRKSPTEPVSFVASPELERFLQSFGLLRIPLRPLTEVAAQPEPAHDEQATPIVPLARAEETTAGERKVVHPIWRRVAAALAVPLVAGSTWWGLQQEASMLNVLPSTGWPQASSSASYLPRFAEEGVNVPLPVASVDENRLATLVSSVSDAATIRYDFAADEASVSGTLVRIRDVVEVEPAVKKIEPVAERYWLVAGAFTVSTNADNYAAEARAKGWNAEVRPGRSGLSLVILGAYPSASAARVEMTRIRKAGDFQVWLKTL
jgi:hypothetical protein